MVNLANFTGLVSFFGIFVFQGGQHFKSKISWDVSYPRVGWGRGIFLGFRCKKTGGILGGYGVNKLKMWEIYQSEFVFKKIDVWFVISRCVIQRGI